MDNADQIRNITRRLTRRLKKHGFIVHRYNSYTSNSTYLKLDYGVARSIRISDHPGKQHLRYRFNVSSNISRIARKGDRHYYSFSDTDIDQLVRDVVKYREELNNKYGHEAYVDYMNCNREKADYQVGFWKGAKEV